jgi:hypothetical protein
MKNNVIVACKRTAVNSFILTILTPIHRQQNQTEETPLSSDGKRNSKKLAAELLLKAIANKEISRFAEHLNSMVPVKPKDLLIVLFSKI